jgi:uncharacterized protein (DUF2141 family)
MRNSLVIFAMLLAFAASLTIVAQESHVILIIKKIQHKDGAVLLSVYCDPSQFAYAPGIWYNIPKSGLKDSTIVFEFDLPKPGNYAIAILDDENSNGELDRNFLGIPVEGFGFSNNFVARGLNIPHYEDLLVTFDEGLNEVEVEIRHWKLF